MERTVLKYAPNYWDNRYEVSVQLEVAKYSEEYKIIEDGIKRATKNNYPDIKQIKRNQNIHDFGQVLIREQLLAVVNSGQSYYRVRRYITVRKQYLATAIEYNLDHRRCGKSSTVFQKYIQALDYDEVILVVQVITNTPDADYITPANSSDYFIDYIVTMN